MTAAPTPPSAGGAGDAGALGGPDTGDADAASGDPVFVRSFVVEAVFCTVILALGLLVVTDSLNSGAGWADDGPQSGYFPFYIGLMLCLASVVQIFSVLRGRAGPAGAGGTPFITRETLGNLAGLLLPLVVYVALIGLLGIYLSSFLFIGFFMLRHGGHHPLTTLSVAAVFPLVFFLMFERWFKVPLPKGPVEAWLGLL